MGKKLSYTIGSETFATQIALVARCRQILDGYEFGVALADRDSDFLEFLVMRHPEHEQKAGVGIAYFTVDSEPEFGGRCFYLHRLDGTATDFSYKACIKGAPDLRKDTIEAFRAEVRSQIDDFRSAQLSEHPRVRCRDTGLELSAENSRVTHEPPMSFLTLLALYLTSQGVELASVALGPSRDLQYVANLANADFAKSWREFHAKCAVLGLRSKRGL